MSGESQIQISQDDMARLSEFDNQDLQLFIQNETQKANIQKSIHELTETCFKKCIKGGLSAGGLTSKEDACMKNCVDRFMDSNMAVLKHLETMRSMQ